LQVARDQVVDPEYAPIGWSVSLFDEVIEATKQALAAPVQEPVALKAIKGELCYLSQEEDQSFGMWCPINLSDDLPFADGTDFYTAPPAQPERQPLIPASLAEQQFERYYRRGYDAGFAAQRKPLTWDLVRKIGLECANDPSRLPYEIKIARAVEAAHGIKEKNT